MLAADIDVLSCLPSALIRPACAYCLWRRQTRDSAAPDPRSACSQRVLPSVRDVLTVDVDSAPAPAARPRAGQPEPSSEVPAIRAAAERWRPSRGAAAAALAAVVVVIVAATQGQVVAAALSTLGGAQLGWLAVAAAGTLALWLAQSVAQLGSMPVRPPLRRLLAVQVAAFFANQLLPGGIGGNAVNVRFLRTLGVPAATAVGAATLNLLATGLTQVLLLVSTMLLLPAVPAQMLAAARAPQSAGLPMVAAPSGSGYAVGVAVLAVVGAVLLRRWARQRRTPRIVSRTITRRAEVLRDLRRLAPVARDPKRALQLWLGATTAALLNGLIVAAVLQALTVPVPVLAVVAVYLAASVLSIVVPAPGAVGPFDLMLAAGLVAVGVPPAVAVATVLGYRLVTAWLPLVPSAVVFCHLLQRRII